MKKTQKELVSIIHKYLPGCTIYLFGSRARNTHRPGADIDLALDVGKKIDFDTILDIKAEIEETTIPQMVDIIDWHSIPSELQEEIKKDGILWTD